MKDYETDIDEVEEDDGTLEPQMDEDDAQELIESQTPEPEPEPAVAVNPEPPPAPAVAVDTVDDMKYQAFCDGIDAACRMYGGLCNKGHKRQMAQKAGYVVPEE